jgi:hypothetical protein
MTVTLTKDGITFTFLDWEIDKVSSAIMQSPENAPITGTGSMGSYVYNYDGATKTISIVGNLQAATTSRTSVGTIKTILEQCKWLECLFVGDMNAITFTSTYSSQSPDTAIGAVSPYLAHFADTTVYGVSFTHDEINGEVNLLSFNMTFVVGKS